MPKFRKHQEICHVATGRIYVITRLPSPLRRLEWGGDAFYEYTRADIDGDTTWFRSQLQMEDGRFDPVPNNLTETSS